MTNSQHSVMSDERINLRIRELRYNTAKADFEYELGKAITGAYYAGARSTKPEFAKEIAEELISIISENAPYVDIINNVGEFAERLGGKK